MTQAEIDAGSFTQTATVSGDWTGRSVSASDTEIVPLVQAPAFTVSLAADISEFDAVGDAITYTATVTNTGNETTAPDAVTVPGVTLTCSPAGALAPGATSTCSGTLTTTTGADVVRAATVTWGAESATSPPVTVNWVARQSFSVTLAADISEFDTVGAVITYTATVTNTGNETDTPETVAIEGTALTCTPAGPLTPGVSTSCSPAPSHHNHRRRRHPHRHRHLGHRLHHQRPRHRRLGRPTAASRSPWLLTSASSTRSAP